MTFTKQEAWDCLIYNELASEQTLQVVTKINGWKLETMEDVLYAVTGYNDFEQYLDSGE